MSFSLHRKHLLTAEIHTNAAYNMCGNHRALCAPLYVCLFLLLTSGVRSTFGVHVYTSVQTRRYPHQNWTWLKNETTPLNKEMYQRDYVLPPLELRDEPQTIGPYFTPRKLSGYSEIRNNYMPRQPSVFDNGHSTSLHSRISKKPTNRVNSYPPWYADKYRRYQRDEADPFTDGIIPQPWNYQPRCRSCGRPLLQDSFCSDDFVLRVFVYKDITANNGVRQYLVYIYDVYKDNKQFFHPTHYSRIMYRCDRFQTGPDLGQVYLITGLYEDGVPNVDSCSWKARWNDVTRQQKRHLRFKYQAYCGICKIQRVLRINPIYHRRSDTCYVALTPNPNELACRDRFSICRYKRQTQSCGFNQRTPYEICEKWLSVKA
ncbi:hypothetical protein T265_08461 [Opisthorchis viverrini]|uniref:NTR domain-containing protein n=2 Tax=Opisthorchis viverrini TaxID=6198 RepID=A0A075A8B8_OPIVI|nr:hypothetical protein T265_08461 [Opisthorchis viverrini]KER23694.1 hypothetical protein T265_08461 [Opisthorchis viverrini]